MAKKFKFRLERVLQYREVVKSERKRELFIKNTALREAQTALQELDRALAENKLKSEGVMSVGELQLAGAYGLRLRQQIEWTRVKISELEKEVQEALERYIEASKDAEALIVLKRKKLEEYQAYIEREEAKFLDELTTQRYFLEMPGE